MAKGKDVYDIMDEIAPFHSALDFDNVGFLVGSEEEEVKRVMLVLDITPSVIEEARSKNVDLILSHHPVIFDPIRSLHSDDVPYLLASSGIAALCCHTNLDISPVCGPNLALGRKLELTNVKGEKEYGEGYIIFSGELEEALPPPVFAEYVKAKLGIPAVRFCAGGNPVKKVMFCTGAGGEYAADAAQMGADAYITGEMNHHKELEAAGLGITVLAAGHYETEKIYGEMLIQYLIKRMPEVGFILSKEEKAPFTIA